MATKHSKRRLTGVQLLRQLGRLSSSLEQEFQSNSVVAFVPLPAIFGSMHGPSKGRFVITCVRDFKGWMIFQDLLYHLRIAVPCGKMQSRCAAGAHVNWPSGFQHHTDSPGVVAFSGGNNLAAFVVRESFCQARIAGEQRSELGLIAYLAGD